MERILTTEQMRAADRYTIDVLGISEEELVNRAGLAIAEEIKKRFRGGRVLVCIGKGNNGADGKVVAEILSKTHGFSVCTLNVINGFFKVFENKFDIIIDCIFGVGLNREIDGKFKTAIEKINASGAYVVACDIPSGICGNTGKVMGIAVKANLTIAIQEYKLGHFVNNGIDYSGELVVKDIGISIWGDDFIKRLTLDSAKMFFKQRNRAVHKGCFGKTAVIGGSKDYTGSVILSANALCAMKMGVGYVNLVVPENLFSAYVGKVPECLLSSFSDEIADYSNLNKILDYDSIAVGMGMGVSENTYALIEFLLKNYTKNLIIDADGLNSLAKFGLDIIKYKKCNVVLTPHIGEFSRLINLDKSQILIDSISLSQKFAKQYGIVLVLKNAVSVITDGTETYLNTTGCSGMSKAGSGDVLSGIIAGLLARNAETTQAVATACYVFGIAGQMAEAEQNEFTMTATDIIKALPKAINDLIK